jgi:hypothetical protein
MVQFMIHFVDAIGLIDYASISELPYVEQFERDSAAKCYSVFIHTTERLTFVRNHTSALSRPTK